MFSVISVARRELRIENDFVATVSPPKINYDLCDLYDLCDFGLRRFNVSAQSEIIVDFGRGHRCNKVIKS
jgi:hypothetical protein